MDPFEKPWSKEAGSFTQILKTNNKDKMSVEKAISGYYSHVSDDCSHFGCYICNVSATVPSTLWQVSFLVIGNLPGILNWTLYLILWSRCFLFWCLCIRLFTLPKSYSHQRFYMDPLEKTSFKVLFLEDISRMIGKCLSE